ncbi:NrsF family protein [Rhizobium leguminosarum]|uniref:NrsF family protein n=1 Tax=Rhizobium leguminosarum TaxID=384 RepID=UPI0032B2836F
MPVWHRPVLRATIYALNCFDDSPLFVATWYPHATALVATAGYFAGNRCLRW